jgi:tetratricopeptide (TPR) repeat protein
MSAASPLDQARQLRDQGRYQQAYTCLQQLRWPQTDLEPYLLKGVLERQLGLINEAHSSLALALGHPGHQGLACYELGELMRSQGQFDAAASWFLAALRQAPQHSWIHHSLQFTRFGPALLPLVAAEYERHCQAYPGDAMALHLLADVQLRLERQSEAIRSARLAARLLPSPAQAAWLAAPEAEPSPPDFVIIGVPKGGTTSLLHWLGHHPQICSHPRKELHFFNGAWEQGTSWYAAQFPMFAAGSGILRGEATPNYGAPGQRRASGAADPAVARSIAARHLLDRAPAALRGITRQHRSPLNGRAGAAGSLPRCDQWPCGTTARPPGPARQLLRRTSGTLAARGQSTPPTAQRRAVRASSPDSAALRQLPRHRRSLARGTTPSPKREPPARRTTERLGPGAPQGLSRGAQPTPAASVWALTQAGMTTSGLADIIQRKK